MLQRCATRTFIDPNQAPHEFVDLLWDVGPFVRAASRRGVPSAFVGRVNADLFRRVTTS